jgi:hypothetical protein
VPVELLSEVVSDDGEEHFEIVVDRTSDAFLDHVFELYTQTPVDTLRRQVRVVFLGEDGIDGGALSREFFFLVFNALINRTVHSRCAFQVMSCIMNISGGQHLMGVRVVSPHSFLP